MAGGPRGKAGTYWESKTLSGDLASAGAETQERDIGNYELREILPQITGNMLALEQVKVFSRFHSIFWDKINLGFGDIREPDLCKLAHYI